jgi:hypothetical protein
MRGLITPFVAVRFIKFASENPSLWTGMKDASAEGKE